MFTQFLLRVMETKVSGFGRLKFKQKIAIFDKFGPFYETKNGNSAAQN